MMSPTATPAAPSGSFGVIFKAAISDATQRQGNSGSTGEDAKAAVSADSATAGDAAGNRDGVVASRQDAGNQDSVGPLNEGAVAAGGDGAATLGAPASGQEQAGTDGRTANAVADIANASPVVANAVPVDVAASAQVMATLAKGLPVTTTTLEWHPWSQVATSTAQSFTLRSAALGTKTGTATRAAARMAGNTVDLSSAPQIAVAGIIPDAVVPTQSGGVVPAVSDLPVVSEQGAVSGQTKVSASAAGEAATEIAAPTVATGVAGLEPESMVMASVPAEVMGVSGPAVDGQGSLPVGSAQSNSVAAGQSAAAASTADGTPTATRGPAADEPVQVSVAGPQIVAGLAARLQGMASFERSGDSGTFKSYGPPGSVVAAPSGAVDSAVAANTDGHAGAPNQSAQAATTTPVQSAVASVAMPRVPARAAGAPAVGLQEQGAEVSGGAQPAAGAGLWARSGAVAALQSSANLLGLAINPPTGSAGLDGAGQVAAAGAPKALSRATRSINGDGAVSSGSTPAGAAGDGASTGDGTAGSVTGTAQPVQHAKDDAGPVAAAASLAPDVTVAAAPVATVHTAGHDAAPAATASSAPADGATERLARGDAASQPGDGDGATPATGVHAASVMQAMGGTEMRVGMHSQEFGEISIRTSVSPQQMTTQISVDHSDLSQAITAHASSVQARLQEQYGVHSSIQVNAQGGGHSGGSGGPGSSGQREQQGYVRSARSEGAAAMDETEIGLGQLAFAGASDGARLDIRA
jgi:hypothetical protein